MANLFAPIFALEDVFAQESTPIVTENTGDTGTGDTGTGDTGTGDTGTGDTGTGTGDTGSGDTGTGDTGTGTGDTGTGDTGTGDTGTGTGDSGTGTGDGTGSELPTTTYAVPNPLPFGGAQVCVDANTIVNSALFAEPNVAYSFADPDPSTDGDLVLLAKVINGAEWDPNGNLGKWLPLGYHQFLNPGGEATFRIYAANGINETLYQPCVVPTEIPQPTAVTTVTATVNVTVADGRSLEGAPWELFTDIASAQPASGVVASGTVGAKNVITIENVLPGDYRLVITPEGQPALSTEITIASEATPVIDVTLDVPDFEVKLDVTATYKVEKASKQGEEYTHSLPVSEDLLIVTLVIVNKSEGTVSNLNIVSTPAMETDWVCDPELGQHLEPEASISCVATYQVTNQDVVNGPLSFKFEVSATPLTKVTPGPQMRGMALRSEGEQDPAAEDTLQVDLAPPLVGVFAAGPNSDPRYADQIVSYSSGTWDAGQNCPPNLGYPAYSGIIGEGDHPANQTVPDDRAPSLGWGGTVTVGFTNNVLVGNGVPASSETGGNATNGDLMILERGQAAERTRIEIRGTTPGGLDTGWLQVGFLSTSSNANTQYFDIDRLLTGALAGSEFTQVRLTDMQSPKNYNGCQSGRNVSGADIDAVWAISSRVAPILPTIKEKVCVEGSPQTFSFTPPPATTGVKYTVTGGTGTSGAPQPGDTITVTASLASGSGYAWSNQIGAPWVFDSSTNTYRYTVTLKNETCIQTSFPVVTMPAATCIDNAGKYQITSQNPANGGITIQSITPNPALGNTQVTVTAQLTNGFGWPASLATSGLPGNPSWVIAGTTATLKFTTPAITQNPCAFPDVVVTKTASPTYAVGVGDTVTFTMVVKNQGTATATGVTLNDPLIPVGLNWQFVGATPTGCSISSGVLSCTSFSLAPNETRTITVSGVILATTTCGTPLNTVSVAASNEATAQQGNNTGSASVSIPCDSNAKIWICHSTGSGTNPYTRNEVPKSQIAGGGGHGADTNDIWPAFEWPIGSDTIFPARGNQALLNEPNCLLPAPIIPTPVQAVCENGVVTRPDITMPSSPFFTYTVTPAGPYSQGQQITIKITTIQNIQLPATFPDSWAGWTRLSNTSAETKITFQSVNCSNATVPTVSVNAAVCQTGVAQPHKLTIPTGTGMTVTSITGTGAAGMSPATIIAGGGWGDYTFPAVNSGQVVVTFTIANNYQWPATFPSNSNGTWAKVNATTATFTFNLTAKDCAATLAVTKSGNGTITAGQNAVFTISVTNTHASNTAYGVKLTDIVPTGYVWTPDAPSGVTCTVDVIDGKDTLNCDIGTLAPTASVKVTLTAPTTINPAACPTLIENTSFSAVAENAAKVNGIPALITVKCVPTIPAIPEADVDPFVCEAGVTSGANTFKVNEGVGFDTFTVKVDGNIVTATAGSYPLPAENGSHTITVTFKLKPGYAAPAGMTAVDGVYTMTRNVMVNPCNTTTSVPPVTVSAVCEQGESVTRFTFANGTGMTITEITVNDVALVNPTSPATVQTGDVIVVTATLASDHALPANLASGIAGVSWVRVGDTTNYTLTFTAPDANCAASLHIAKSVKQGGQTLENGAEVDPGSAITWVISVWNTGNGNADNVVVTDTLPNGFTVTSLPTNCAQDSDEITCTLDVPVTYTEAAPLTIEIPGTVDGTGEVCGLITNNATYTYKEQTSDEAASSVTIDCDPDLSVAKGVRIGDTGDFGDTVAVSTAPTTVQYQVTVANTGNTTLTNVAFEDTLSNANEGLTLVSVTGGTITWETGSTTKGSIGSIPVDGSVVVIYSYIVNQNDLDTATAIQNCAEATKSETVSDTECATVTKNRMPNMAFSKVGNGSVTPGGDMVFTIELTNTGNITISNAVISDVLPTLPSGSWTAAVTDGGAYFTLDSLDDDDNEIGTVTNLPPTKSVEITLTATVPGNLQLPNAQWCAEFTNSATVSGTYVSITAEAFNVDDSDTIQVNCTGVSITKSGEMENDGAKVYAPGDTVTYTVTVSNDGNTTVNGITVTDNVPSTLTNVTVSSAPAELCSVSGNTVTCANVSLDGGDDLVVTITGKVPAVGTITWEQCESELSNTASMSIASAGQLARSIGPGEQINSNTVENDIDCGTGLTVEKTAADGVNMTVVAPNGRVDEGDTITYTFVIKNTGDTTLYGVDLTDSLAPNVDFGNQDITNLTILPFAANPANAVTITGVYTITQVDINALDETGEMEDGFVENCASAAGMTNPQGKEDNVSSEEDCVVVDDLAEPGIDAAKTADPVVGPLSEGDLIDFTITVTNTGNTTQTDVDVVEDMVTGTQLNVTVLVDEATSTFGPVTVTYDATSGVISIAGEIPVGGVVTIPVTYAVTQDDLDRIAAGDDDFAAGMVENCVEVAGDTDETNDCVVVDGLAEPGITLVKSSAVTTGDDDNPDVDETITYSFVVTNTGNVTLSDVAIADPMVGLTWPAGNTIASLAPGQSVTLTATYVVQQADVDRGMIQNCADVTSEAPDETAVRDLQSCTTQEIEQSISLAVMQECPGAADTFAPEVGQEIAYTMTITNDGTVTVHNVEVTTSREGTFDSPQADYDAREITVEITVTGEAVDGSAMELASMAIMQTPAGDSVTDTIMLTCKMAPLPTPEPTAPVTKLPETGNGGAMSATAALWIAATVSMVALGAGALGLRYKARS